MDIDHNKDARAEGFDRIRSVAPHDKRRPRTEDWQTEGPQKAGRRRMQRRRIIDGQHQRGFAAGTRRPHPTSPVPAGVFNARRKPRRPRPAPNETAFPRANAGKMRGKPAAKGGDGSRAGPARPYSRQKPNGARHPAGTHAAGCAPADATPQRPHSRGRSATPLPPPTGTAPAPSAGAPEPLEVRLTVPIP